MTEINVIPVHEGKKNTLADTGRAILYMARAFVSRSVDASAFMHQVRTGEQLALADNERTLSPVSIANAGDAAAYPNDHDPFSASAGITFGYAVQARAMQEGSEI